MEANKCIQERLEQEIRVCREAPKRISGLKKGIDLAEAPKQVVCEGISSGRVMTLPLSLFDHLTDSITVRLPVVYELVEENEFYWIYERVL